MGEKRLTSPLGTLTQRMPAAELPTRKTGDMGPTLVGPYQVPSGATGTIRAELELDKADYERTGEQVRLALVRISAPQRAIKAALFLTGPVNNITGVNPNIAVFFESSRYQGEEMGVVVESTFPIAYDVKWYEVDQDDNMAPVTLGVVRGR